MITYETTQRPPLLVVLLALLALTALSYGLTHVRLGALAPMVALVIALTKVATVGTWFMDLRSASATIRIAAALAIAFIGLLCAGVGVDVALR